MTYRMLFKNMIRDIWNNRGRFISILLITVLGTSFYTGLKASSPDMIRTVHDYYEDYNLMDIHFQSFVGFSDEQIDRYSMIDGINKLEGQYHLDVESKINNEKLIIRLESYNNDYEINKYRLVKGEFPKANNEILIEDNQNLKLNIGDTVHVNNPALKELDFKIVGVVTTPKYLNYERGRTHIGDGVIDFYMVINANGFNIDRYTDIYITLKETMDFKGNEDNYFEITNKHKKSIYDNIKIDDTTVLSFDRNESSGYISFYDDALKVATVADVIPIFFILIAILITLSTMTRMVNEQRIEIGTLSSLGNGKFLILLKYIIYAFVATFFGSIIGVTFGLMVIPQVIIGSYNITYILPNLTPLFRWDYFGVNIAVALISIEAATILATIMILRSTPANLLRGKAPVIGKKIFLERIGFIWRKISFKSKMTLRNLGRYKARTIITIIGIAGCTGLMLTCFGFYNAITEISNRQFSDIFIYDAVGILKNEMTESDILELNDLIDNQDIDDYLYTYQSEVIIDEKEILKANLVVPMDDNKISNFINLQNRKTDDKLELNTTGVIINEKLSIILKIKAGDNLEFISQNGTKVNVPVIGITENYTYNFIYMSKELYIDYLGEFQYNFIYFNSLDEDLNQNFGGNNYLLSIIMSDDNQQVFQESSSGLTSIVILIIFASALLAFVVLYNLSNINITERSKELSTFKVLGMYDTEITMYMGRENLFSTVFGIAIGLLIGVFFLDYVILVVEPTDIMFIQDINVMSYIYTSLLTIVFSIIVSIVFHWKIKSLDMVEAMKAIE